MPLVTTKDMFEKSMKEHFAIGAFNVNNMEIIQAITDAAAEENSPVILQASSSAIKYARVGYLRKMVEASLDQYDIPVVLHLDHGPDFETCKMCIDNGFSSVMIDGSKYDFEENVALTKKVVDYAHSKGVVVEAELGKLAGIEDEVNVAASDAMFTDPDQAKEFVERTGVDSLAVGIGTAHGVYKGEPKLQFDILSQIREVVDIPLVLHGTSGVPDEAVEECIKRGICKVNYATDLRIAFTNGLNKYLAENPDTIDPKKYSAAGREEVKKYVMSDEDYNKRKNTYRAFKLQTEQQHIDEFHNAETEYPASSVDGIRVGDRCEVSPGGRRGTVKWTGVLEMNSAAKGGYWVGIALDEPTGRNNGSHGVHG